AAQWRLWSDSPPLMRGSALRLRMAHHYDLLFLISNPSDAQSSTGHPCSHAPGPTPHDPPRPPRPPHPPPTPRPDRPQIPASRFKIHNVKLPERLTSSRSIENAPALTIRTELEARPAGAFPIQS